jgi:hypothetical protein
MGVRLAVILLVVGVTAACSGGTRAQSDPGTSLTAQQLADRACRSALRHPETFATAQLTTVGAMHRITGPFGRASHPWSYLYKGKPDGASAVWCWRSTGARSYQSYVVGPGGPIFLNVYANGVDAAPVGPMAVT